MNLPLVAEARAVQRDGILLDKLDRNAAADQFEGDASPLETCAEDGNTHSASDQL
jgi:hypothetical protein